MRNTLLSIFALALLCGVGATARAEVSYDADTVQVRKTVEPVWVDESMPDTSAFKYLVSPERIPVDAGRTVPGVVEVSIAGPVPENTQAIILRSDGSFAPALYIARTEKTPVSSIQAEGRVIPDDPLADAWNTTPEGSPDSLIDGDRQTSLQFEYYDNGMNTATIMLRYEQPITTNTLTLSRASNVMLPLEVRVRASNGAGEVRNVLANTRQTGDRLVFPQTTADYFEVTFTITQPLRLSELSFTEQGARAVSHAIRYLELPGDAVTLFMGADRQYGNVPTGGVSLADDRDVTVYEEALQLVANPAYVATDTDEDGIPDSADNCPREANPDQKDANGNGKGDACDDHDRDGLMTSEDNCPDTPNRDQRDTDGDGVGDVCDNEENRFTEANPWVPWVGVGVAGGVLVVLMAFVVREGRRKAGETVASVDGNPANLT